MDKILKEIKGKTQRGTIRDRILKDSEGEIGYIKDVANLGCSGGACLGLIYYSSTHKFYQKYADEIDELLEDYKDNSGVELLKEADIRGDLRNFLAWWAYESEAQKIIDEVESMEDETKP